MQICLKFKISILFPFLKNKIVKKNQTLILDSLSTAIMLQCNSRDKFKNEGFNYLAPTPENEELVKMFFVLNCHSSTRIKKYFNEPKSLAIDASKMLTPKYFVKEIKKPCLKVENIKEIVNRFYVVFKFGLIEISKTQNDKTNVGTSDFDFVVANHPSLNILKAILSNDTSTFDKFCHLLNRLCIHIITFYKDCINHRLYKLLPTDTQNNIEILNTNIPSKLKIKCEKPNITMSGKVKVDDLASYPSYSLFRISIPNLESLLKRVIRDGRLDILIMVVENDIDLIHYSDPKGTSALHLVAKYGQHELIQEIIDRGADVNLRDLTGKTSIMIAAMEGHLECLKVLIQNGADICLRDYEMLDAVLLTIRHDRVDCLECLLSHDSNLAQSKEAFITCPLTFASSFGNIKCVSKLLSYGASIDFQGSNGKTALIEAASKGYFNIVILLIQNHANIDLKATNENSALMFASSLNLFEIMHLLIHCDARVNTRNREGVNTLMRVASNGGIDFLPTLLKAGANLNLTCIDKRTALMHCIERHLTDCMKELLENGAMLNYQDDKGNSPLMYATRCGAWQYLSLFIDYGANIEYQNPNGVSSLMIASFTGDEQCLKILIEGGANINLKENKNETAIDYAKKNQNDICIGILKKALKKKKDI